jgi:hypothetical protein
MIRLTSKRDLNRHYYINPAHITAVYKSQNNEEDTRIVECLDGSEYEVETNCITILQLMKHWRNIKDATSVLYILWDDSKNEIVEMYE